VIARTPGAHRLEKPVMGEPLATEGRGERLSRLVAEHFDSVFRAMKRFGAPASLAEDGAQQVFLIATTKLQAIELASERAFLLGTAFRVAKELRRRAAEVPRIAPEETTLSVKADSSPALDEVVDQKRARLLLDDLLAEMDHDLRAVFVLYEIEDLTVPEIAEALSIAPGTVASRLRRARGLFQEGVARHQAKDRFQAARATRTTAIPPGRERSG